MSLSEKEYNDVAAEKQLQLVGYAPPNVYTVAVWRCLLCGREHHKTYRAVRYGIRGCICTSTRVNQKVRYQLLGSSIGIEFLGTVDERSLELYLARPKLSTDLPMDSDGDNLSSGGGMGTERMDSSLSGSSVRVIDGGNYPRQNDSIRRNISGVDETGESLPTRESSVFGDSASNGSEETRANDGTTYILDYRGDFNPAGVPRTTKELVAWRVSSRTGRKDRATGLGTTFLASFQQLSYGNGKKIRKALGLTDE